MTRLDFLVFIPIIPAFPVIATWFLPWERWVMRNVPKKILGPYLLYCAFAAWYFKMPSWGIILVVLCGIGVSVFALVESNSTDNSKSP